MADLVNAPEAGQDGRLRRSAAPGQERSIVKREETNPCGLHVLDLCMVEPALARRGPEQIRGCAAQWLSGLRGRSITLGSAVPAVSSVVA